MLAHSLALSYERINVSGMVHVSCRYPRAAVLVTFVISLNMVLGGYGSRVVKLYVTPQGGCGSIVMLEESPNFFEDETHLLFSLL